MALDATQQSAVAWIEANRARLSGFNKSIWNFAEPAWREYKSCRAYCELLRAEGFAVEQGSGGMPTAFAATWGSGSPVLGSYAEYDAVPGQSQQVVPYKAPREGLHPWTAGHTDPHSSLGSAAVAGILATKAAMQQHGLRGTLKFFGEPAEKGAARNRCTRPRVTTTVATPSSPIIRTPPTRCRARLSAAPIGAW